MSKNKLIVTIVAAVVLIGAVLAAGPALALAASRGTPERTTQDVSPPLLVKVILRLLLVQDESTVNSFLTDAVNDGRIEAMQARKIKQYWTRYHEQFAKNTLLRRLLNAEDEARVKSYLDQAVTDGKMSQARAERIIQIWETIHSW